MLCRYYLAESGRVKDKSASAATIARRSLCSQTRRQAEEETRREDFHACVIDTSPKGQRERKPKPLLALRASICGLTCRVNVIGLRRKRFRSISMVTSLRKSLRDTHKPFTVHGEQKRAQTFT